MQSRVSLWEETGAQEGSGVGGGRGGGGRQRGKVLCAALRAGGRALSQRARLRKLGEAGSGPPWSPVGSVALPRFTTYRSDIENQP